MAPATARTKRATTNPRSAFPILRMSLLGILLLTTLRLIPDGVLCLCRRLIHRSAWKANSANFALARLPEGAGLYLELLRPEGLPEPLPGGLHELRMAHVLAGLLPGEVAAHVVLLERLLEGHLALVHAVDEVAHDLLLALGEGRGLRAAEEPLPEGRSLAHIGPQLLLVLAPCPWTRS